MPRKLEQIETEALKLGSTVAGHISRGSCSKSLDPPTETDHERAWYDEAERREGDLDEGKIDTIPAREVFRRLKSEIGKKRRTG